MIQSREKLEQYLFTKINVLVENTELIKNICVYANKTYDIPKGVVSDLLSNRIPLNEANEFVLFILLDSIIILNKNAASTTKKLTDYYTDQEIKYYKESKYEIEKVEFPLKFKMVEISKDQWIGRIDIDELMKLRKVQLINYNENAQRTMQKIVRGDKLTYKISVNKNAVKAIKESFESNLFIPNTITLNIPMETNYDFVYDPKNMLLIIKSLERFDITDGYHRYLAACHAKDNNPNFNYSMELRIINFTEDKAKQFIYQEDQKTKMTKMNSNSYNMDSPANMVVTRLNENVRCNFKGLIDRNNGIIDFGELSSLVDYYYFKNRYRKEKEREIVIQALKELTDDLNMISEFNTEYLTKRIEYRELLVLMYCFNRFREEENKEKVYRIIQEVTPIVQNNNSKKFFNKIPRKALMTEIEKAVEEVI